MYISELYKMAFFREQEMGEQLKAVLKHSQRTTEDWKEVLWIDESEFEIFS